MRAHRFPIAVRLLGLPGEDEAQIAAELATAPKTGPRYFCLHADSLQDPDIIVANGEDLKAVQQLAAANPGPLMPGLVLGRSEVALLYPRLDLPLEDGELLAALGQLLETRAAALADANLRSVPLTPERRRRERLDLDLTDP